jgi:hypothetical protein
MQIDMHYYGTYALARAAGIKADAARIIATAAQYVDDNIDDAKLKLSDGARFILTPTAHEVKPGMQLVKMLDEDRQRQVWVPFHFLPANQGTDYTERLVCWPNSAIAEAMVAEAIACADADDPCALERMGITAHVYADTFAHWGFSGISSRRNRVKIDSFVFHNATDDHKGKLARLAEEFLETHAPLLKLENIRAGLKSLVGNVGDVGDTDGALGHGGTVTYPDLPYLNWSFEYDQFVNGAQPRDNPSWFMTGCKALHDMFRRLAQVRPDLGDGGGRSFHDIQETVRTILAEVDQEATKRILAWQTHAKDLFGETIPPYQGGNWTKSVDKIMEMDSIQAFGQEVCRFHLAAEQHRSFILYELLPSKGLVVA